MKKILLLLLLLIPLSAAAKEMPKDCKVYVFTAPHCRVCHKMKSEFLPELKKAFKNVVEIVEIDTTKENLLFKEIADAYGAEYAVPAMAVGDSYLLGYPNQIGYHAAPTINAALDQGQVTRVPERLKTHEETFKELTFFAIIFNGFMDGFNPCAFAVIVFFISFLAVYKYTKKEIIYIGIAYCSAVFLAYFLLGFGIFKFLYAMRGFQKFIFGVYWLTIILCMVLFFLAMYDFIVYLKTRDASAMKLQLSKTFKVAINKVTGKLMRDKKANPWQMGAAAFAVGLIVSVIEAACTGQVYLPTIVLIMNEPHFRLRAITYLMLYNFMFIVPLIAVFVLTLLGYTSDKFNNFLKKNMALIKLLLALIFLGLAVMLYLNL